MSSAAHGHNEPHVSPLSLYLGIFGALLVLTVLTVYVSAAELFHGWASIGVAMTLAVIKASLVATIFMHMKWDRTFNVIVFLSSLWFAGLFFFVTWFDISNRTRINPIQAHNQPTLDREAANHEDPVEESKEELEAEKAKIDAAKASPNPAPKAEEGKANVPAGKAGKGKAGGR